MQIFSSCHSLFCIQCSRNGCCIYFWALYAHFSLVNIVFLHTMQKMVPFVHCMQFFSSGHRPPAYCAGKLNTIFSFSIISRFSWSWHFQIAYMDEREIWISNFSLLDGCRHILSFHCLNTRWVLFSCVALVCRTRHIMFYVCYFLFQQNVSVYLSWKPLYCLLYHTGSYALCIQPIVLCHRKVDCQ